MTPPFKFSLGKKKKISSKEQNSTKQNKNYGLDEPVF